MATKYKPLETVSTLFLIPEVRGAASERPGGTLAAYLRDPDGNKLSARTVAAE